MNHRATETSKEIPHRLNQLTGRLIGAAIEVHRNLGPGFLESAYEEALAYELKLQGIEFQRQVSIQLYYKGVCVGEGRLDLIVGGQVVVELKAVEAFKQVHRAQVLSYMKAGSFELGLLINFNVPILRDGIARLILS